MFVFEQLNISSETKAICIAEVGEDKIQELITAPGLEEEYFPLFIGEQNISSVINGSDRTLVKVTSKEGDEITILKVSSDFPKDKAVQEVETYLEIRDFDFGKNIEENLESIYEDSDYEVFRANGSEYLKIKIGSSDLPFGDLDSGEPQTIRFVLSDSQKHVFLNKEGGDFFTLVLEMQDDVYSFVDQGHPSDEALAKSIAASDSFTVCESPEYEITLKESLPVARYLLKADDAMASTGKTFEELREKDPASFEMAIDEVDKNNIVNRFGSLFMVDTEVESLPPDTELLDVEPVIIAQIASCSMGGTWQPGYTMLTGVIPEEILLTVSQNIYQDEELIDSDDDDSVSNIHRGPVSLKGMTFCVTGRFDEYKKQSDFAEEIEDLDGIYKQNMSNKVDALIKGNIGQRSTTTAIEEAESRGTPIIDYEGFELLKHGKLGKTHDELQNYADSLS